MPLRSELISDLSKDRVEKSLGQSLAKNRASCVLLVPGRPYGPIQGGVFRTERCPQWLLRLFRLFVRCWASFGRTLTTDELANILHLSKRTIYRRIKANVIPSRRSGGQLRFDPGKVAAWWDGQVE